MSASSLNSWCLNCAVCGAWNVSGGQPASLTTGVVEPAGDGAVDDVVTDLDPEAPDQARVEDDVQLHGRGVLRAQCVGQPLLVARR